MWSSLSEWPWNLIFIFHAKLSSLHVLLHVFLSSCQADIRKLDDKQKLLLYLQLPSGSPEQDVSSKRYSNQSPSPSIISASPMVLTSSPTLCCIGYIQRHIPVFRKDQSVFLGCSKHLVSNFLAFKLTLIVMAKQYFMSPIYIICANFCLVPDYQWGQEGASAPPILVLDFPRPTFCSHLFLQKWASSTDCGANTHTCKQVIVNRRKKIILG